MKVVIPIHILSLALLLCSLQMSAQQDLRYYLEHAEAADPVLREQALQSRLIDIDRQQALAADQKLNVDLNGAVLMAPILARQGQSWQVQWFSSGATDYIGYDLGASNGGQFLATVSLDQPLFTGKNMMAHSQLAAVEQESLENQGQLTRAGLQQAVTGQYLLCLGAQAQCLVLDSLVRLMNDHIRQLTPLVDAGVYPWKDLQLLKTELLNDQSEAVRLEGQRRQYLADLRLLCGIDDTTLCRLADTSVRIAAPLMTGNSLFTGSYRSDSLRVLAMQSVTDLGYLPRVDLIGDAGLNATWDPRPDRMGFSVGLALKWKLMDGHRKQLEHQRSAISLQQITDKRHDFMLRNDIRRKNILQEISSLDRQLDQYDMQVNSYRNLLSVYPRSLQQGLVSVWELKTLVREMARLQLLRINLLTNRNLLINEYNYRNQ